MNTAYLNIIFNDEVLDAISSKKPIVSLESNVLTHGLKYPDNLTVAVEVENAIRSIGAVPATIGIENGNILVGMDSNTLKRFATNNSIKKVSSRDLPIVIAKGESGATTVASSLMIADHVGIRFFASAGVGGVHRGAENTMDISPDLMQLTRSKVAVICAGVKNILDINLTMEYLETYSVPVISYKYDYFPAFYCRSSGLKSPHRIDTNSEIVSAINNYWNLGNNSSILITKPINESDALDNHMLDIVIEESIIRARKEGISGNSLTKFLMFNVDKATNGKSSKANASVLISNARFAAKLALEYSKSIN